MKKDLPWWRNPINWNREEQVSWGPFVYSWSDYRPLAFILSSWGGGEDNDNPCHLRMSNWLGTFIISLPPIIRPHQCRVYPGWDDVTARRLGRNYYDEIDERSYGFNMSRSGTVGDSVHLSVMYGRAGGSSMDSSIQQQWSCFLPWTEWRHVRHSYYGLRGEFLFNAIEWPNHRLGHEWWRKQMDAIKAAEDSVPTMKFTFEDYDGEIIVATTRIEEREWRAGKGWFKWLSWFRKPIIHRSLCISFSSEVGRRKGSWKGGTLGHSIEMDRGPDGQFWEGHLGAFLRYCTQNELKFITIGYIEGWEDEVAKHKEVMPDEQAGASSGSANQTVDARPRSIIDAGPVNKEKPDAK